MNFTFRARGLVGDNVMAPESISGSYSLIDGGALSIVDDRGRTTVYAPGAWYSIEHD